MSALAKKAMIHQTACLSLKNLTIERNQQRLFQGLTLDCHLGQAWQIIGPNGSGKSSLLSVLAGLSKPRRGRAQWHSPVNQALSHALRSCHSLYLSHDLSLKAQLTVYENLNIFLALQVLPVNNSIPLEAVLRDFDLEPLRDRLICSLSAGQQRRVNLAKLGLSPAKLWLLDEPFTALDQDQCAKLAAKIEVFVQHRGLVIFTSHQPVSFSHLHCHRYYLEH